MTTDLSGYAESEFSDFPWDDFESIMGPTEVQMKPLDRSTGPSGATRTGSPLIRHCGKLQPQVDTPLSPLAHERGPSYGPNVDDQQSQMHHPIP